MRRSFWRMLVVLVILGGLFACSSNAATQPANNTEIALLDRPEIPDEYAGLENPLVDDEQDRSAGKDLFQRYCASCHGETGAGDGPAGVSLSPAPENLAENEDAFSDAYLYWRISEGGLIAPFNSVMPAWKSTYKENEIWQIITYIRQLGE